MVHKNGHQLHSRGRVMKISTVALSLATALSLAATPLASASAHDRWHHHDHYDHWRGPGPVAAVVGAAAALVTAPFAIMGALASPPPAPVEPVYATAPPAYYGYPGYYGYPQPAPVVYGYPAPGYYVIHRGYARY